ncbi:3-oxoacyl-ACP reductase FabG [Candidatus Shapirobacteria bacterium]|nr:3-oxoacyl-ACP reductase FabG [Candidatus Shapirobacteria bacterium]
MFDLTGKKALITGSSRGIGQGVALSLAKQGADVVVNYHSKAQEAEAVVASIKALGRDSFSVQADVADLESIKKMFAEVQNRWGKLDILVNNAGILQFKPFGEVTLEDWEKMVNTNLRGQYFCAQEAVKIMSQGGRIINIASISSGGMGIAYPQISHYTTAKGGVVGMTEALAVELGPRGINVNAIAPGGIETDMTKQALADEKTKQAMIAQIPKGRMGKPEDIGAAAAFLASSEADYITGAVLYVDGGWLAA